jgi:ATP-binding cassette subfamily B protein
LSKREFRPEEEYRYARSGPVRWIVSHALRYPVLPLSLVLMSALDNYFYGYRQIFIGQAFGLIASGSWEVTALVKLALGVAGATGLAVIADLLGTFSVETLAQRIERDTRDELYVSLLGKSQTFHGRQRIGDIMARATNDVRRLNLMFSPGLGLIISSFMAIAVPAALIASLDWRLLLAPAVFILLWAITVADYNRRLRPVSEAQREQFGQMNSILAEAVTGIEVVKSSAQEEREQGRFVRSATLLRDYVVQEGRIQANYLPMLVFVFVWAGGLMHALLLWRAGVVDAADVVAFAGLLGSLRFPTFISIFSFNLVQLGVAGARRILDLIRTETELDENEGGIARTIRGEVVFDDVFFGHDGSPVLQNVSFTARPGETIAIVGQTGSGKSTLTQLINRIYDVDSGRVLIDGSDVREWSLEALRSQISTIEQDVFLFSRTLAENIAFGCADANPAEIERAARQAQAHDFISALPEGYSTVVGERGVTLSGGERQRVAIARAFLTDPRILVLDDSTSAIDSATEDHIQRAMRLISQERTTFVITHRLSQIRWADRILVMRRGQLVDHGTHDELMERSEAYRRIFSIYD